MLLCKPWLGRRAATNVVSRSMSDAATTGYHPKVRAFPFAFAKEEAIRKMALPATYTGVMGGNLIRAFLATHLPWLGVEPPQPTRIQAAYIPAWTIDAEIEGKVWITSEENEGSKQRTAFATIMSSYVPGLSYEPLSRISFDSPSWDVEPSPFSDDLRRQHGSDVICLPFTHSPLALLDAAQSLSMQAAKISDEFRFDPSSLKANLLAVYPVLVPVYLAQYETQIPVNKDGDDWSFENTSFTVVVEAHQAEGRTISEFVSSELIKPGREFGIPGASLMESWYKAIGEPEFISWPLRFTDTLARIDFLSVVGAAGRWNEEATEWAQKIATSKGAWANYQKRFFPARHQNSDKTSSLDWDDPRIRTWTTLERSLNLGWLEVGHSAILMMNMRELFQEIQLAKDDVVRQNRPNQSEVEGGESAKQDTNHSDADGPPTTHEQFLGRVQEKILSSPQFDDVIEKRRTTRPEWYIEWERQNVAKKNA